MPFRIRQDTEEWFKHISDKEPLETKFDIYYLCLLIGLAARKTSNPTKRSTGYSDFVENFVLSYRPVQRLLIGLLMVAELAEFGLDLSDKEAVRKEVRRVLDPTSPTHLSEVGMSRLNEYSSGGFDYLVEHLETKPHTVEEFLQNYVKLLQSVVDDSSTWKQFLGTTGRTSKKSR